MSQQSDLMDAVKAVLDAALTLPTDPTASRLWRIDVLPEDVATNGSVFVTIAGSEPARRGRNWKRNQTVQITFLLPITTDSPSGPSNADAFADIHERIFDAITAMDLATHQLEDLEEVSPLEGENHNGLPLIVSAFSLTLNPR